MYSVALSILMFWLATPAEFTVVSVPTRGSVDLDLLPAGRAEVRRQDTLTRVRVQIDRVPAPATLGPGMNIYVVWAASPEGDFENVGEAPLSDGRIRFEGLARYDQLAVLVTAEPHYLVDRPSSLVAFRNQAPRDDRVRRMPLTAQVGRYDYSMLPQPAPPFTDVAAQAQSAYEIARLSGAERLAEAELRFARVALDTTEELLNRAAPPEIILPSAHEAVRRSHRAFQQAREVAAANELAAARSEAAALNVERQQLTARVEELTQQQAAAAARIGQLEADLASAGNQNRLATDQIAQTQGRLQAVTVELEELRRRLEAERPTSIRVPDDYVSADGGQLTAAGREALTKIVSTLGIWNGPLRIEASAGAMEILQKFFVDAGIEADRVVFVSP